VKNSLAGHKTKNNQSINLLLKGIGYLISQNGLEKNIVEKLSK
jgi:hypothetical protein